ncbi:MAG: serine--tRNA ligase [Clostridia bacterium]|nr:serine--tRNA ligase [Clostridia bacterium]
MLDLKLIRQDEARVRRGLERRGASTADLDRILALDAEWRGLVADLDNLRAERNRVSQEIGRIKREGGDASAQLAAMSDVAERIRGLEARERQLQDEIESLLLRLPNLPDDDVPDGPDDSANVEVRRWGEPARFPFEPKAHWDLGPALGLLDFERAGKITGSRFTVFLDRGARLLRALVAFMLDFHTARGFTEVLPPFLVNSASMTGTGQLPKFGEDAFRVDGHDLWLVPTAEVPVTNLHRDEILSADQLPIYYCAYTPCFRSEAGAAGRDTRGLIRQHQFDKVELVKFVRPEDSAKELETLTAHAAAVLEALGLPYRVVALSTGDLGFASAHTYDLEVWMPSYGRYVEISSCSNFRDFQARRANIRYRPEPGAKPQFVHTLNGSGLAVGRTFAALLENYQREDGSVRLPEVLAPYLGGQLEFAPQS